MKSKIGARLRARRHLCGSREAQLKNNKSRLRLANGNMLIFISACTIGLLAALAFFGLGYVRLLGSNNEQRTAIEAASLAAARDLSMIAINTKTFSLSTAPPTSSYGWVSLSDYAPSGSSTAAPDKWDSSVRSINTILATIRLDLIIADQIGDANLITIIESDLTNAQAAQATLYSALQDAISATPKNSYTDINGNPINVYQDAKAAYIANQIRMTGSSNYVDKSLVLSLGAIENGSTTNIPIPSCGATAAQVPSNAMQSNDYMSYVDIPYNPASGGGVAHFMLAAIGTNIKLVEPKLWTASLPGLTAGTQYLPTIVRAQADQLMHAAQGSNGDNYTVRAVACAQPADVVNPVPAPGALSFSFPDGTPPEMTRPADMLTDSGARVLNDNNQGLSSFQYSSGGDYPFPNTSTASLQTYSSWPYASLDQNAGNIFRQGLYDWWKRAGTRLNVASAVSMMSTSTTTAAFQPPTPLFVPWNANATVGGSTVYNLAPVYSYNPLPGLSIPMPTTLAVPQGIPNGSIHIYNVDPTTSQITYQSAVITPIPYSVAGQNQLYSECLGAITNSSVQQLMVGPFQLAPDPNPQTYHFTNVYDLYMRDQVYSPGTVNHEGEPMDCPAVSLGDTTNDLGSGGLGCRGRTSTGGGKPPAVVLEDDFAENIFPLNDQFNPMSPAPTPPSAPCYYYNYSTGPGSNGVRPTYQKKGMAMDIRFRQRIQPDQLTAQYLNYTVGYVGEKLYGTGTPVTALPLSVLVPPPTHDEHH